MIVNDHLQSLYIKYDFYAMCEFFVIRGAADFLTEYQLKIIEDH